MVWSCGFLVASTVSLLGRLPTKQTTPPPCSAPARPPRSTASALAAGASPPSTALNCCPLPPFAPLHSRSLHCPSFPRGFLCASRRGARQLCRATEYVFPDPIPEFAEAETDKFRSHMMQKLSKKDICGTSVEEVVGICTGILNEFLHAEYGGPGTLLVIPFIDMADTINERGLPGGPQAARAAVVWAQKHVDKDWNEWTGRANND